MGHGDRQAVRTLHFEASARDSCRVALVPRTARLVLVGSADRTARFWETATGKPLGLPLQHQYSVVVALAFSPDGKTVLTGSVDGTGAALGDSPPDQRQREGCTSLGSSSHRHGIGRQRGLSSMPRCGRSGGGNSKNSAGCRDNDRTSQDSYPRILAVSLSASILLEREFVMSPIAFLRSFFGAKRCRTIARPRSRNRCKPLLELLEDRLAPATVTWINANGGDWASGSNWNTGHAPSAGDDAVITGLNGALSSRIPPGPGTPLTASNIGSKPCTVRRRIDDHQQRHDRRNPHRGIGRDAERYRCSRGRR